MMLVLLRQAAAHSNRKCMPARIGSFLATTLTNYVVEAPPLLRRSLSQCPSSLLPQRGAGGWPAGHGGLSRPAAGGRTTLGVQDCLTAQSGSVPGLVFQRHIWMQTFAKKDVAWLRRKKNTIWGGFRRSNTRHFGGGGYVDPQLALGALIATNVGVFFLWRSLGGRFMQSNFVVSAEALKEGRLHTLVTSAFSQFELQHLLSNMIGLYFFGSEIGNLFGGQRLILLYLTGGIVGSLTHLAYWTYVKPWVEGYPSRFRRESPGLLGSSGAVNAIILLDILLFPTRIIYMNLIIPIPAALFGLVIIGSDVWTATNGSKTGSSPAAHLGGAIVGALAWLKWR